MPGNRPYMHHLGVFFSITAIEEIQHVLFKLFAILVDSFSRLGCIIDVSIRLGRNNYARLLCIWKVDFSSHDAEPSENSR